MIRRLAASFTVFSSLAAGALGQQTSAVPAVPSPATQEQERNRTEIPMDKGGVVVVYYDRLDTPQPKVLVAQGRVHVVYDKLQLWADRVEYHQESGDIALDGNVRLVDRLQFLNASRARYNLKTQAGSFWEASGRTNEEMLIKAARIDRLDAETYRVEKGFITACQDAVPKWVFGMSSAKMVTDHSVTATNAVFKIKKIPILYLPWVRLPLDRGKRSSGFLLPTTGTSTSKGRTITQSLYLTLGRSADATVALDFFSKRGFGYAAGLRMRPNAQSHINLSNFYVDDRLRQGGDDFSADAEVNTANGFRGVAVLNLVTNFAFRQNFADTFHAATNPLDHSTVFLTKNFDLGSVNFATNREETFFPSRSVLIRSAPGLSFQVLGRELGAWPIIFSMDSSIEGLKRRDGFLETPNFVPRVDFFPHISFPLVRWTGFSLTPRLGFRETFYSRSYDPSQPRNVSDRDLFRSYLEFELDLKGPALARVFTHGDGSPWFKHWIEPALTYRRVTGIDDFGRVLKFDDKDIVTDTHELEYGLVNRVFIRRGSGAPSGAHEFLSLRIAQQYYFDPTFGGSFTNGTTGQIESFARLTPFPYGAVPRHFSPLVTTLRLNPEDAISLDLRLDYDARHNRMRAAGVSGSTHYGKLFAATTLFMSRKLDPGSFQGNQLQTQVGYGSPGEGWSGSWTASYDLQRSRLLNTQSRLSYGWDCCGVAVEFLQFDTQLRNETQFRFSFSLKGLGHFGTIRRPESLF